MIWYGRHWFGIDWFGMVWVRLGYTLNFMDLGRGKYFAKKEKLFRGPIFGRTKLYRVHRCLFKMFKIDFYFIVHEFLIHSCTVAYFAKHTAISRVFEPQKCVTDLHMYQ